MEKTIKYMIEHEVAKAIIKITGKINDTIRQKEYGLTEKECELLSEFYNMVEAEDEEETSESV
jgi:hypothetical protein|tara:strand:- start:165 stop:353 length:189 start_codon:yes stop_codon:yes gene_type:complete